MKEAADYKKPDSPTLPFAARDMQDAVPVADQLRCDVNKQTAKRPCSFLECQLEFDPGGYGTA